MDILLVFLKAIWCGVSALGFGMLFNSPSRSFAFIWFGGFMAGLVKFGLVTLGVTGGIVTASFAAAITVGLLSIPVAHSSHVPPVIFSIPSVIPLVPGVFAYKTILGIIKLTSQTGPAYIENLGETFQNGSTTMFTMLAISLGVAVPMHVLRTKSVKNLRLFPKQPSIPAKNLEK